MSGDSEQAVEMPLRAILLVLTSMVLVPFAGILHVGFAFVAAAVIGGCVLWVFRRDLHLLAAEERKQQESERRETDEKFRTLNKELGDAKGAAKAAEARCELIAAQAIAVVNKATQCAQCGNPTLPDPMVRRD